MTDVLVLDLVRKGLVTDQMVLTISYESVKELSDLADYDGEIGLDWYGRYAPKHAHGTANLGRQTSSTKLITDAVMQLYEKIVDDRLMVRRINVCANNVVQESDIINDDKYEQLDLFTDYETKEKQDKIEEEMLEKERSLQLATLTIKNKYGKNAILKGTNFLEGATMRDRNKQIGGHKA